MSRTLSDLLHEYAVNHHARVEAIRVRREEWIATVRCLMDQFRQWLQEADKEGVLYVVERTEEFAEQAMGRYEVPALEVTLGPTRVKIKPMGRSTIGRIGEGGNTGPKAEGRVDITDGTTRYVLYRALEGQGSHWVVIDPENHRSRPLTRELFEDVMARLLG